MSTPSLLTPGRLILLVGNVLIASGSYFADWNKTHIYNPRWPPHAKFHNGQTMTLGVLLASMSIYFVTLSAKEAASQAEAAHNLWLAAMVGSLYCGAGICAILYPGTDWIDPEFKKPGSKIHQGHAFSGFVAIMWMAYGIEMWRMG